MGLLDIGQALAAWDNVKRRVGLLMADPGLVAQQNTATLGGNLTNMARGSVGAAQDMSSVVPQVAQQGQQQLMEGLLGAGPLMTVYHGSPHVFDKFDSSKIGTGEGAQAYGHGLYFAENPSVAKQYANELTTTVNVGGKPILRENKAIGTTGNSDVDDALIAHGGDYNKAMESLRTSFEFSKAPAYGDAMRRLEALRGNITTSAAGNVYKTDLPDAVAAKMLQWDAPMTEQPASVRDLLHTPGQNDAQTGGQFYHDMALALGSRPAVAAQLQSWGIPGIRYLDAGSRASGQGTSNFVVFPGAEGLLNILGRE